MKPIEGMTTDPAGLPLMGDFWLGCLIWAASQPEIVAEFEQETGHSFDALRSRGIDKLIDEATGRQRATLIAWADWVTKWYWGVEGEEPED